MFNPLNCKLCAEDLAVLVVVAVAVAVAVAYAPMAFPVVVLDSSAYAVHDANLPRR